MTIKRILLLLSAMAAFVAFAAPAAQASGEFFTSEGTKIGGEEEAVTIEATGELSSSLGGLTSGPCTVHAHGDIWNGPTMGEGRITSFTITASHEVPCKTNVPNCVVATASTTASPANPWPMTLTPGSVLDISNVSFTNRYTGCGAIGIPDNVPITASGTVTGSVANEKISFVNAGHLVKEGGGAVVINGSVGIPGIGTE